MAIDGLFPNVLKTLNAHISPLFARMCNLSLQTAQVPEDIRRAIVSPIAKNPAQQTQGTSDPSAVTPVVCKVLALPHLSQFALLTTRQHSFLLYRSTVTNLLPAEKTVTRWLDEGDTVDIDYLDSTKAFDSVNYLLPVTGKL